VVKRAVQFSFNVWGGAGGEERKHTNSKRGVKKTRSERIKDSGEESLVQEKRQNVRGKKELDTCGIEDPNLGKGGRRGQDKKKGKNASFVLKGG